MDERSTTLTDARIGRTLGRYRVEREVGRGGMGVVYQGRQLSLNRLVAIKVLPPQMAADPQFRERFHQEAQVIATLTHENILHVYDIEESENTYFIVMEFIEGQSLRAIREARRLTSDEIRAIGIALARALACAHQQGVIHRDVKSHNVMVTREGKVKLMDFGIARVAGGAIKTATGSVLGTPDYMAPEQARSGEATPQTDIYSLGVLLFELATGRMPFTAGDPFAIALKHITEPVPAPRSLDPTVPEWLERVILKAMEKDPAQRYALASELEQDLLVAGHTRPTAPAPLPPSPGPPSPGPPSAWPAAPPAYADGPPPAGLAPAGTVPTHGARSQTYATFAPSRRLGRWVALAAILLLGLITAAWLLRPSPPPPSFAKPAAETSAVPNLAADPPRTEPASPPPSRPEASPRPASRPGAPASSTPQGVAGQGVTGPAVAATSPIAPEAATPAVVVPPPPAFSDSFHCRRKVEFHVDPEDALITIDGRTLGKADDWDGVGGGKAWQPPAAGAYYACFQLKEYHGTCVQIVIDPAARKETCGVGTSLDEIDD